MLTSILNEIANNVQPGIKPEEDPPSANEKRMMAIPDMSVWISPKKKKRSAIGMHSKLTLTYYIT